MTKYTYTDSFKPDSTLVQRAFYHRGEQNLFVQFSSATIYGYEKVSSYVYDAFSKAESAGNYYNLNIKGKYKTLSDIETIDYIGTPVGVPIREAQASKTHKFVIVGFSPVEYTLEAETIDDAKADFARIFPNGTLKEVRVHFE